MNQIVPNPGARTSPTARHGRRGLAVPAAIAGAGDTAVRRFLEFFAATIRNKNTRMAYYRAVTDFFAWLDAAGIVALVDIEPLHDATYIEALQERMAKPTVKQHLAAIRMLAGGSQLLPYSGCARSQLWIKPGIPATFVGPKMGPSSQFPDA
jgi:hypothetical protein